jgi:hypothetical protein
MKEKLAKLGIWLICLLCCVVSVLWMFIAIFTGSPRYWTIALGIDRTGNATSGGDDSEYLSARASRARREGRRWGCVLCRLIAVVAPGHCERFDPPTPPADAGKL